MAEAVASAPARYLIELELSARQSGVGGRAELMAGARLAMAAERSASGELRLVFARALEAPWKLFHVDPVGPFGRQTKVAAVITLPEASWEALAEGRAAHARFAAEQHARWRPAARRKPPLDGAFAFVVIGPAARRFNLELDAAGRVRRVENRMTDRWLNGDFSRFVGTWGPLGAGPEAARGYWFWNRGESEPFPWQPGTYQALAAALELLAPTPEDGGELFAAATGVLASLAPSLAGRGWTRGAALPIKGRWSGEAGGETVRESRAENDEARLVRRRRWSASGPIADRLELVLAKPRQAFRLTIGYRPHPNGD